MTMRVPLQVITSLITRENTKSPQDIDKLYDEKRDLIGTSTRSVHHMNASLDDSTETHNNASGGITYNGTTAVMHKDNVALNTVNIAKRDTSKKRIIRMNNSGSSTISVRKTTLDNANATKHNKSTTKVINSDIKSAGFIHLGKTGGSTLSFQLRNGCHSFIKKPCRSVQNETVVSELVTAYYHSKFAE